ncbi:S41 family peptidase [Moraxellaceae bacterium AER2_44_116]|nr:S41 family peptidase [Moraxellaceae bacterium]TQC99324.1 S41 family peptidase [Moraxellaceae bacterium AER2_44_116]
MNSVWRVAICTLALQQALWADETQLSSVSDANAKTVMVTAPVTPVLPLTDLRTFVDVFERIRHSYVDPVDDKTLFENAIKGMLSALDPHSAYLDKNDYQDLKAQTTGEFGGIGVEISMDEGYLRVVSPIDDTPASKAGIQAGDYITKLEGKAVKGMTMSEAVDIMRGAIGTPLKLTIQRRGEEAQNLTLIRSKIEVGSVKTRQIAPDYSVVRISQFQTHTGRDLTNVLIKLKETQPTLKGIILDLRNNPGGVLGGAISVADAFIDKGLVVYTKARTEESVEKFEATEGQILPNIPLLVLVNGGSASASEIVAGALQDHHRAIIAGTSTFGKGSVQTVLPISEEKGIKLTTARYYTPNGRSIQAEGIKPDVVIEPAKLEIAKASDNFKEADLKGHLVNPNDKAAEATNTFAPATDNNQTLPTPTAIEPEIKDPPKPSRPKNKTKSNAKDIDKATTDTKDKDALPAAKSEMPTEKSLAEDDYVLYAALNVLKGATFWQSK